MTHRITELGVFDFAKFMGALGEKVSGAFGLDAFDGRVVTLSVARHTITLETDTEVKRIAHEGVAVPIRIVRAAEGAALTFDIGVPSKLGTLWMEIDTGNNGPSMVDTKAAALLGLNTDKAATQRLDAPVADRVRLQGPVVVRDMIMDGNIGRAALKDWDVTLDLAHGRGWLRRVTQ